MKDQRTDEYWIEDGFLVCIQQANWWEELDIDLCLGREKPALIKEFDLYAHNIHYLPGSSYIKGNADIILDNPKGLGFSMPDMYVSLKMFAFRKLYIKNQGQVGRRLRLIISDGDIKIIKLPQVMVK